MKKIILIFLTVLFNLPYVFAQKYVLNKTISLPGEGGNDYVYIDQAGQRLYASHGTAVNVVDLKTEKPVGVIGGMKGVHGIAVVNELHRGFISDGKANAVVAFDTQTLQVIKTIPVTGKGPDGIIYDPFSKLIFTFEGDSNAAVAVDPTALRETGTVALSGTPEFAVADGKGLIYNNLEDKSRLAVIDTRTLKEIKNYPLAPCGGPTGLAVDAAHQRLFTVCRENKGMSVIDITTGKVTQTLPIGAGVDAVVYDAANQLVIASNGDGTANVFKQNDADHYTPVQTLITQYHAKTMCLDPATHRIYFPVSDYQAATKAQVPGSFKLLVYQLQ
jgi:YVTN family beta-propeller protein